MGNSSTMAHALELPDLDGATPSGASLLGHSPALLNGVSVRLSIMVGEASTTLGELMALREASVLKLDRTVDAPVDVLVNGKVVARGQLVAVDDHFGVRITEIAKLV
jgi:flagellar motor switch protein FliN/FliY